MSSMNFSVDMDRVQSTVQAKIRPAVEAALADVDVIGMIQKELIAKPPEMDAGERSMARMMYGRVVESRPKIEAMVSQAIHEVAQEFVRKHVRAQRESIEDALTRMLAQSNSKIAKSFAGAIERAFKEDWSFELDVKVSHTTKRADDD